MAQASRANVPVFSGEASPAPAKVANGLSQSGMDPAKVANGLRFIAEFGGTKLFEFDNPWFGLCPA